MCPDHVKSVDLKERGGSIGYRAVHHSFRADMREVIADLWQYRELLYQLISRDIRVRYKQAVMGLGWAICIPALIVLVGIMVKYAMAQLAGKELETGSIASMMVKSIPWSFFVGTISSAANSLISNGNLVTKIYCPRMVFPLSATLAQTFDTSIGLCVLCLVLPFLGMQFSLALLWVPFLGMLLFLFTVAMALLFSCANLFFRDVKYIVQVMLTFGIFFTPVFFEPAMFGPVGSQLIMLNPLAPLLEGLRLSIVEGNNLFYALMVESAKGQQILLWSPWYLAYSACWAIIGLTGICWGFHRSQFLFAEYI